jgi:hypothetical protein
MDLSTNGVTFEDVDGSRLRPGAQLCSKHHIRNSHAVVAHLSVNSVGSCLINQEMTDAGKRNRLRTPPRRTAR